MGGLASALSAGTSLLNATNSYGNSSSYGYNISDSIQASSSRLFGSEASASDILRAAEANEMQKAFMEAQQTFNSAEAQKQREWEEYMSNTAYQRAVKDMVAAGINPILAGMNVSGASTPSGSSASASMGSAHKANTYADQESSSSGKSQSKGENWSSSMMAATTQLMDLLDSLGGVVGGVATTFGSVANSAVDVINSLDQKTGNRNKQYNKENPYNTSSPGATKNKKQNSPQYKEALKRYYKANPEALMPWKN